jgi:hypothetical protein
MEFFDDNRQLGKPHPVWALVPNNTIEVKKAGVKSSKKCLVSSWLILHKLHMSDSRPLENFARSACRVYVRVRSLHLTPAFLTSMVLFGTRAQTG